MFEAQRREQAAVAAIDRAIARRILVKGESITRDASHVDVEKWDIPDDTHLLKSPLAFRDELVALLAEPGCKGDRLLHEKTHGRIQFRPHETTLWLGYQGSYKSTFLTEMAAWWACRGVAVAIASLEMPAVVTLRRAVAQALAVESPRAEQIDLALERMAEALTIYDVVGRMPARHLISVMRYCAVELGVRHFILDNLTMVLSVDNDRQAEHQRFVADCMMVAKTTGLHVHLVSHTNKPEKGDESRIPNVYDARGTGAGPDMVDNVIAVWRNKPKENKIDADRASSEVRQEPDVLLSVGKQRHWNFQGQTKLWFDPLLQRFKQYGTGAVEPMI